MLWIHSFNCYLLDLPAHDSRKVLDTRLELSRVRMIPFSSWKPPQVVAKEREGCLAKYTLSGNVKDEHFILCPAPPLFNPDSQSILIWSLRKYQSFGNHSEIINLGILDEPRLQTQAWNKSMSCVTLPMFSARGSRMHLWVWSSRGLHLLLIKYNVLS